MNSIPNSNVNYQEIIKEHNNTKKQSPVDNKTTQVQETILSSPQVALPSGSSWNKTPNFSNPLTTTSKPSQSSAVTSTKPSNLSTKTTPDKNPAETPKNIENMAPKHDFSPIYQQIRQLNSNEKDVIPERVKILRDFLEKLPANSVRINCFLFLFSSFFLDGNFLNPDQNQKLLEAEDYFLDSLNQKYTPSKEEIDKKVKIAKLQGALSRKINEEISFILTQSAKEKNNTEALVFFWELLERKKCKKLLNSALTFKLTADLSIYDRLKSTQTALIIHLLTSVFQMINTTSTIEVSEIEERYNNLKKHCTQLFDQAEAMKYFKSKPDAKVDYHTVEIKNKMDDFVRSLENTQFIAKRFLSESPKTTITKRIEDLAGMVKDRQINDDDKKLYAALMGVLKDNQQKMHESFLKGDINCFTQLQALCLKLKNDKLSPIGKKIFEVASGLYLSLYQYLILIYLKHLKIPRQQTLNFIFEKAS